MKQIARNLQKLYEKDAFGVLLHPKAILNYRLYQKECREKPTVMRSTPPFIEVEMTNRCNLACTQCLRSLGLKPYQLGEMSLDNYGRILDQFPNLMGIALNGFGEPMMYPHFFDVVAYTRKARPWAKIEIYSNGMLIDETNAYRLMGCGLTTLNISIDAARPETYARVRRGGNLCVLHDNIRTLVKARRETRARFPQIGLNFVMVNDNEGELVEFVEQAHDLGVDFINCISWASYDWGFTNHRTPESYFHELGAARRRIDELGLQCKSIPKDDTHWTDPDKPFDCNFFWGPGFRVTFDGSITLGCCSPFKEQFTYGNLLERPFREIWNNEDYQRNRELSKRGIAPHPICDSCQHYCRSFFAGKEGAPTNFVSLNAINVELAKRQSRH